MTTPWTRALLDDAAEHVLAGRRRTGLHCVLTVLSVYPELAEALHLARRVVYYGLSAKDPEPLTFTDICDPRLDSLFCSCEGPDCTGMWISFGQVEPLGITVLNPRGGRCVRCGGYFCRNHFGPRVECPRCGGSLDHAPRVNNGRPAMQTVRLNQPLVHVHVMREGTGQVGPEYMTELLSGIAPDVFEDSPTISGNTMHPWPDDCLDVAVLQMSRDRREYLDEAYDLRVDNGHDRSGTRWAVVKVFAKMPKYVDPDFQQDLQ